MTFDHHSAGDCEPSTEDKADVLRSESKSGLFESVSENISSPKTSPLSEKLKDRKNVQTDGEQANLKRTNAASKQHSSEKPVKKRKNLHSERRFARLVAFQVLYSEEQNPGSMKKFAEEFITTEIIGYTQKNKSDSSSADSDVFSQGGASQNAETETAYRTNTFADYSEKRSSLPDWSRWEVDSSKNIEQYPVSEKKDAVSDPSEDILDSGSPFESAEVLNAEMSAQKNISYEEIRKLIDFAKNLSFGVLEHRNELDAMIEQSSKNWAFSRIVPTDRCLLELAAFEMIYQKTPTPIVINEAIELAKVFCTENSPAFINGVLHRIGREYGS